MQGLKKASLKVCLGLSATVLAAALSGCQSAPDDGLAVPSLTPITKPALTLRTLPAPTERIAVAVYDFPDLTGQYKDTETVQTLSRAVTQGGAPMLISALEEAGQRRWFSVLDRARLDDLLKERQIVTEMRRIYRDEKKIDPRVLPPLDFAGIIMAGGIIGYDTNTMTGGLGARYLGIGADAQYRQDTVTVTLRAISTKTGEVLASVTVHKVIASYGLQGNVFRYVTLDSILEGETGVTRNEPKQIAVQQAIEKAVTSIIIEGANLGIWRFADPAAGQEVIAAYEKEKYGTHEALAAQVAVPPETRNPAQVIETRPVMRTASVARPARAAAPARAQPAQPAAPAAPAAPPPAKPGETVGAIEGGTQSAEAATPAAGTAPASAEAPPTTLQRVADAHM